MNLEQKAIIVMESLEKYIKLEVILQEELYLKGLMEGITKIEAMSQING